MKKLSIVLFFMVLSVYGFSQHTNITEPLGGAAITTAVPDPAAGLAGGAISGGIVTISPNMVITPGTTFNLPPATSPGISMSTDVNGATTINFSNGEAVSLTPVEGETGIFIFEKNNERKKVKKNKDGSYTVIGNLD